MAVDFFNQEENKDEQGQPNAQAAQPKQIGGESAVIQADGAQGGAGKPSSSGNFTSLNSYLDANKDQNFGSQVAGSIGDQIGSAEAAQKTADTGFRGQVDKNTVQSDKSMLGQLDTDPTKVDQSGFEKQRDASYQGPKHLVDTDLYQPAQKATDSAAAIAEQTKDEGGRKAYLNQQYGAGAGNYGYSSGQQKLDNLLIQQDPNAKAQFLANQQRAASAKNQFGLLNSALDTYAQKGQQTTAGTRAAARGAIGLDDQGNWLKQGGAINTTLGNLDTTVAGKKAELAKDRGLIEGTYDKTNLNQMSPEALKLMGIDSKNAAYGGFDMTPSYLKGTSYAKDYSPYSNAQGDLYGQNTRNYSTLAAEGDLNRSTLADTQMQSRIAALSKLAGKDNTFIVPGQAGRMVGKALYTANGAGLTNTVGDKATRMQAEMAPNMKRYTSGMDIATDSVRKEGNAIRAKYGLPPLGN